MLNHSGIGQYLDAGSLSQFASRIMEILPDTESVAVCDAEGPLVWCGPSPDDAHLWAGIKGHLKPASIDDRCTELASGARLYQFRLQKTASGDVAGILAILVRRDTGQLLDQVRGEISEILSCIVKQLDIRLELSAVRQQSGRERQDMQLLSQLDELQRQNGKANTLQQGLQTVARHFGSELAVMAVPNQGIRHAWRPDGEVSAANCEAMVPILSSLVAAARQRGRVLIADAAGVLQRFARIEGEANLLSSPIFDDSDVVVGVLGLVSKKKFSRYDVRLIRVVSSRIAALMKRQKP
ncbi:MAG: GAF domain-containing protein, partial [Woeseia sp.]